MILGRNPALFVGLGQAALNVIAAILVVATNQPISPAEAALFAAVNAFLIALVAVIANEADPTTVGTFALTTHAPGTDGSGPIGTSATIGPTTDPATMPDPSSIDPAAADPLTVSDTPPGP